MLDKMQKYRKALGHEYQGDAIFLDKLITAIKGSPELAGVLEKNPPTSKETIDYLRMANRAYKAKNSITTGQYIIDKDDETMYTDRNYRNNNCGFRGKRGYSGNNRFAYRGNMRKRGPNYTRDYGHQSHRRSFSEKYGDDNYSFRKRCFICHKSGCWSNKHSEEERQYATHLIMRGERITNDEMDTYIADFEGDLIGSPQYVIDDADEDLEESTNDGYAGATFLSDCAFTHRITG
ncbi:integrase and RNaseH domain-containing protein [Golovinomyces cichoracearum]|uniref:Integrase and RNaseH domain-containing protein n=1 Tax=Golovinomyces cichoracearum TaxID=62708 RepID=A0A420J5E7_9PEZI|nr:integrase and RNaseH domain-containing protein [Golovinomyces cichoracearum]